MVSDELESAWLAAALPSRAQTARVACSIWNHCIEIKLTSPSSTAKVILILPREAGVGVEGSSETDTWGGKEAMAFP